MLPLSTPFSSQLLAIPYMRKVLTNTYHSPGRFYASAIIKVILAQILLKYDCNLVEETPSRYMTWRTTMIPKHQTMVRLTPCTAEAD